MTLRRTVRLNAPLLVSTPRPKYVSWGTSSTVIRPRLGYPPHGHQGAEETQQEQEAGQNVWCLSGFRVSLWLSRSHESWAQTWARLASSHPYNSDQPKETPGAAPGWIKMTWFGHTRDVCVWCSSNEIISKRRGVFLKSTILPLEISSDGGGENYIKEAITFYL